MLEKALHKGVVMTIPVVKWNMFGSAKKVADWFKEHVGFYVGAVEEPEDCPLKNYLKETHPNIDDISVGDTYTTYRNSRGETVRIQNPQWAGKFVRTLDRECGTYIDDDVYGEEVFVPDVTGGQALNILRKVTNYRV